MFFFHKSLESKVSHVTSFACSQQLLIYSSFLITFFLFEQELFLLGLISSRWQNVVEQVTSLVGEYPPVIEQYLELHKFHQGRAEYLQLEEHSVNSKVISPIY